MPMEYRETKRNLSNRERSEHITDFIRHFANTKQKNVPEQDFSQWGKTPYKDTHENASRANLDYIKMQDPEYFNNLESRLVKLEKRIRNESDEEIAFADVATSEPQSAPNNADYNRSYSGSKEVGLAHNSASHLDVVPTNETNEVATDRISRNYLQEVFQDFFFQKGWKYSEQLRPEGPDLLPLKAMLTPTNDAKQLSIKVLRQKFINVQLRTDLDHRAVELLHSLIESSQIENPTNKELKEQKYTEYLEEIKNYIIEKKSDNNKIEKIWVQEEPRLYIIRNKDSKDVYITNFPGEAENIYNIKKGVFATIDVGNGEGSSKDSRGYEIGYTTENIVKRDKECIKRTIKNTGNIHIYINNMYSSSRNDGKRIYIIHNIIDDKTYITDDMTYILKEKFKLGEKEYKQVASRQLKYKWKIWDNYVKE